MAGIDELTYVSGKKLFVLVGDGVEGHHWFDRYEDALNALKRIKTAKEDYERIRATRDRAVFFEVNTVSLPDGYTLFVFKIGDEVISGIIIGPASYFARGSDIAKLIRNAWKRSGKKPEEIKSTPQPPTKTPGRT